MSAAAYPERAYCEECGGAMLPSERRQQPCKVCREHARKQEEEKAKKAIMAREFEMQVRAGIPFDEALAWLGQVAKQSQTIPRRTL